MILVRVNCKILHCLCQDNVILAILCINLVFLIFLCFMQIMGYGFDHVIMGNCK